MSDFISNLFRNAVDFLTSTAAVKELTEKTVEAAARRMPSTFLPSLEDERLFNSWKTLLRADNDTTLAPNLDRLQKRLSFFERKRFIEIQAGMPCRRELVILSAEKLRKGSLSLHQEKTKPEEKSKEKGKAKEKKEPQPAAPAAESCINDEALRNEPPYLFLKEIAKLVGKNGVNKAYKALVGDRVIIQNPVSQQALNAWRKSVAWARGLTPKKIAEEISKGAIHLAEAANQLDRQLVPIVERKLDPILKTNELWIEQRRKENGWVCWFKPWTIFRIKDR